MRVRLRSSVVLSAAACLVGSGVAAATGPTDPAAAHPAYGALNMPTAWDIETGSPEVVIAIVDSGVDPTHPDLAGAVLPGYDFVEGHPTAGRPTDGHGTAVAGAAAARADNGIGGVGTCFRCSILPLRVLGPGGVAAMTDVARAIDFAVDHGAAVINVSLYGENRSDVLRAAILRANAAGVIVVAAAGNEATDTPQYPAAFPWVISVGAATYAGVRSTFSSYGPWVGYAAPECAPVPVLGGSAGVGCMTSTSSPLVAGIVALMRARDPYASPIDIATALTTAARARPVEGIRAGFVDAAAALRELPLRQPRLDPSIVGRPVVGGTLEALTGVWRGAGLRVTYAWERCRARACAPIPGADASRYRVEQADAGSRLRAVLYVDGLPASLAPLTPRVASAPRLVARPSIDGRPRVGARLVAKRGRWQGTSLRYTVTWQRCRAGCVEIATGAAYRARARDRGARLRVEVFARNALGTAAALSRRTPPVR